MKVCDACKLEKPDDQFSHRRRKCRSCYSASQAAYRSAHKPTPTHNSWRLMLARCENPNSIDYARYSSRGITVCERWHTFENFLADMGERPAGKTLDRIDNDKGYEPGNCRWATRAEQVANSRIPKLVTINGRTQSIRAWLAEIDITDDILCRRLKAGWPRDLALTTPSLRNCGNGSWRVRLARLGKSPGGEGARPNEQDTGG